MVSVNLEYSNKWPVITEKKDPNEAEEYANIQISMINIA